MRRTLIGLATLTAAAAIAAVPASATAAGTTLTGTVGPEDTIALTNGAGHNVSTLKAGSYTIVIQDKANDHNFHLTGPGVNRTTSVGGTGRTVWHVTLKRGTYRFVCDPHASFMKGSLTVR